jgi:hypothetical protein
MAKGTASSSSAQRRITQLKEEQALLQQGSQAWNKIEATIEQIEKRLTNSLSNMEDFSDSVASLGQFIGKNNKLFEAMNTLADDMSVSMDSIAQAMKHDLLNGASKFKKELIKTADVYKNFGNTVATYTKKLAKQQVTTSQYNQSVLDGYEDLEEQIDRVEASIESLTGQSKQFAKETLNQLKNAKERTAAFAAAAEKSKKNLEGMGFAIDTAASTGIPAMNELGGVIKAAAEGGMGLALAFAALGAALGKMAYDLGFVGDKLGTIASYDKKLAGLKGQIDAINQQVNLGIFGGRNFVKESAILDFSNTVTQMGIEFEAASKTALFGEKLGGVGYGAAQLQMAGIAAETIATAMKDASSAMGSNVSGEFGADMALLAARTGQTSEGIASISDTFMRLDGVSKETSLNMQEGLRTMAKQADVNLGALMEDVAEASKDALSYQIKSGPALAKAATFAASLGTKFTDIANAGKNMVLNYKDSIKAEMSLSAMLGRRVDLSQVRALFAAGRTEDAIKALKAQGLDPSKMNLFQQEALKNATGGLDLNSLQKIATRTGRTGGELEGEKVKVGNKQFILTKNAAESAKAIGSAVASAMIDVQKTLLESKAEQQRQQAIEDNTQGLKDLMNSLNRTEMMKSVATGFGAAIPMLIGAAVMYRVGPKILSKALTTALTNAGIATTAAKVGATTAATAGSQFAGLKLVGQNMVHNSAGKFVSRATADAFKANLGWVAAKNGVMYAPGSTQAAAILAARQGGLAAGAPAIAGSASPLLGATTTASPSILSAAKPGYGARVGSNVMSSLKGKGGILTALFAAYEYNERKNAGQTTTQATAGAGAGAIGGIAGGALAGAAFGATAGSVVPVVGTIIGGMLGYMAASSIADSITGANEPVVESQEKVELILTDAQIVEAKNAGLLLSDSAYTVELQKEMVAELGLANTLLYEIAEYNARGLFQSVNIDGKKVLEALTSTSRKQFGISRTKDTRTVSARPSAK